jgi:hypothetical protein
MNKMKNSLVILLLITSTFLLIKCNHRNNISENKLSETTSPDKTSTISKTQLVKKEISKHQIKKLGGVTNFQKLRKSNEKEVQFKYYINKSYFR